MPTNRNLIPGQYQIGDLPFGFGTMFSVQDFDIGGYDVNVQDYQSQLSDETRMGSDTLKGLPIQIIINAFQNSLLPNIVSLTGDNRELNFDNDHAVGEFTKEWRADEVRKNWGELKPIYICRKDGTVVQVYGRPGKCQVAKPDSNGMRVITAEFRRSDTFYYSDFEWFTQVRTDENSVIFRSSDLKQGDAPSWLRFFLVGPMNHPIIELGDKTIELDHELEPGEIVEISSYPWQRRVIRLNDGLSLNAKLVRPYLEELLFDVDKPLKLSWSATDTNTQIEQRDFNSYINTTEGLPSADWYPSTYDSGTGQWRINAGQLIWDDSGNQSRKVQAIFKTPTIQKYQTVGMTIGSPAEQSLGGAEPWNRIIGRSNQAGTEYMYWDITFTECRYGYRAPDGSETVFQKFQIHKPINILHKIWNEVAEFFGVDAYPQNNWEYEAEFGTGAGLLMSNLYVNKVKLFTFSPNYYQQAGNGTGLGASNYQLSSGKPFNTIALGEDSLYTGIGMQATTRGLGQSTPGTVKEFHMRDNPATPLNVSAVYMMWRDAWQNL